MADEKVRVVIEAKNNMTAALQGAQGAMNSWRASVEKAQASVVAANTRINAFAEQIGKVKYGIAAAAAAAMAMGKVLSGFAALQEKMAYVNTVAQQSAAGLQSMTERVSAVAKEFGVSAESAAAALYDIYSNIGETGRNMDILRKSAMASVAGFVDMKTTGAAVTGVLNAMGMEVSQLDGILDAQFKTVERGKVTYQELADNSGRFLATAKSAGQEYSKVMGGFATLTKAIGNTAESATAMNAMLTRFKNVEFVEGMKRLGIEVVDGSGKFRDYVSVLEELNGKLRTVNDYSRAQILQKLVPDIEARRALDAIFANFDTFVSDVLAVAVNNIGAVQSAFSEMANTTNFKIRKLNEEWLEFVRGLGADLSTNAGDFFDVVSRGIKMAYGFTLQLTGAVQGLASMVQFVFSLYKSFPTGKFGDMNYMRKVIGDASDTAARGQENLTKGGLLIRDAIGLPLPGAERRKKQQEQLDSADAMLAAAKLKKMNSDIVQVGSGDVMGALPDASGNFSGRKARRERDSEPPALLTWMKGFLTELGGVQTAHAEKMIEAEYQKLLDADERAAEKFKIRREESMKRQALRRTLGTHPAEIEASRIRQRMREAEIDKRFDDEAIQRQRELDRALSASDPFALRKKEAAWKFEDMKKIYGDLPELERVYIEQIKEIDKELDEHRKQQADYYRSYNLQQLRGMLSDERMAREEKDRIRGEIEGRIGRGELGKAESFAWGWDNAIREFQNFSQIMEQLGRGLAERLRSGFSDAFFAFFKGEINSVKDLWKRIVGDMKDMYLRALAEMAAKKMMMELFGDPNGPMKERGGGIGGGLSAAGGSGKGGSTASIIGSIASIASIFAAADGGVFRGALRPIAAFANGGIVNRPTLAAIGEGGGPEAVIPLKGGAVPVRMRGGGGHTISVNMSINTMDAGTFRENAGPIINEIAAEVTRALAPGAVARDINNGGQMRNYFG